MCTRSASASTAKVSAARREGRSGPTSTAPPMVVSDHHCGGSVAGAVGCGASGQPSTEQASTKMSMGHPEARLGAQVLHGSCQACGLLGADPGREVCQSAQVGASCGAAAAPVRGPGPEAQVDAGIQRAARGLQIAGRGLAHDVYTRRAGPLCPQGRRLSVRQPYQAPSPVLRPRPGGAPDTARARPPTGMARPPRVAAASRVSGGSAPLAPQGGAR